MKNMLSLCSTGERLLSYGPDSSNSVNLLWKPVMLGVPSIPYEFHLKSWNLDSVSFKYYEFILLFAVGHTTS
jgi:hypothetical protein